MRERRAFEKWEDHTPTYGDLLPPAHLLIEIKLIRLEGYPASSASSVVSENGILLTPILFLAHVDETKVSHSRNVVGFWLRCCRI